MMKFFKGVIYLLLLTSLLSGLIYTFFPDLYASYVTGYSIDSITGYVTGNFDKSLLCKEFFPREVYSAMENLFSFTVLTFIISFIFILLFKLVLIIKNKDILLQLKNTFRNFTVILSLVFIILFIGFTSEHSFHYFIGCEHFQSSCRNILENPENVGAKNIEELHARGEYLYCD